MSSLGREIGRVAQWSSLATVSCAAGVATSLALTSHAVDSVTRCASIVSASSNPFSLCGTGWYSFDWRGRLVRGGTTVDPPVVTVFGDTYATSGSGVISLDLASCTASPSSANVTIDSSGAIPFIKLGPGAWNLSALISTDASTAATIENPLTHSLEFSFGTTVPGTWDGVSSTVNVIPALDEYYVSNILPWTISVPTGQFAWVRSFLKYLGTEFLPDIANTDFITCVSRADESGLGPEPGDLAVRLMVNEKVGVTTGSNRHDVDYVVPENSDRYFEYSGMIFLAEGRVELGVWPREAVSLQDSKFTLAKLSDG